MTNQTKKKGKCHATAVNSRAMNNGAVSGPGGFCVWVCECVFSFEFDCAADLTAHARVFRRIVIDCPAAPVRPAIRMPDIITIEPISGTGRARTKTAHSNTQKKKKTSSVIMLSNGWSAGLRFWMGHPLGAYAFKAAEKYGYGADRAKV